MSKKDITNLLLNILICIFKPSLAKAISLPLLLAGIGILNSPLWLDIVNWFLTNQELYSQFKGPISVPKESTGWIFISISIFVFLVDSRRLFKSNSVENTNAILEAVNKQPNKTAEHVVKKLREFPFSAPHIIDEKINRLITEIKSLRFFGSFPTVEKSIQLANNILDGELAGGSSTVKSLGLALSARYLSQGDNLFLAKEYLEQAKKLVELPETKNAEAFIVATESTVSDAISMLADEGSATNYSAIFMLKKIREESKSAIEWLGNSGLTFQDLDVDGQISYISALFSIKKWEVALDTASLFEEEVLRTSPAMLQLSAFAFLTNSIKAIELRESVMHYIPLGAEQFPLSDDLESRKYRSRAIELFKLCSDAAFDLGCLEVADMSSDYALWLELRDPNLNEVARQDLKNDLSVYSIKALRRLPLAHAFGLELNYEKIEEELNRQTTLCNNTNPVLGTARLILAFVQTSPSKVVEYINLHREQLSKFVNKIALDMLEVEALARSGLIIDAEKMLDELDKSGTPAEEIKNLKSIITSVKSKDPIALAIVSYESSNATNDLAQLVNILEKSSLKDKYLYYVSKLFSSTGTEVDAIRVTNSMSTLGKFSELHQFLVENKDLIEISPPLRLHWAWSLFRKGDLATSQEQLLILKLKEPHHLDVETLEIHLAIYSGNWDALTSLIESKWAKRDELDSNNLLQLAQLAKAQAPRRAKEILEHVTRIDPDNSHVLASAYFTATSMGWEDNQSVSDWLNKATRLSGKDGPLYSASFDEIKEMVESRREQNEKVNTAYEDGTAPIFTIAEILNRSLSDFYLIQPLENMTSTDLRNKSLIAVFHSARKEQSIVGNSISLDVSSALILNLLDLLDLFFECFQEIFIPHSLMRWLYEEKQKIAFHQPSQVKKAIEFERLVTDKFINIIEPKSIDNPELALNVGDELAFLLEEAKQKSSIENQVLVITSYPVYRVGSFRENEINLEGYKNNLSSCIPLISKLKEIAAITEDEYKQALQYLTHHDKEWPYHIKVDDKATIFLDSLSVTYLMTVGMLNKFKETGLKVFIHNNELLDYQRLRKYESSISDANVLLEGIRGKFSTAISSGKIILSEMQESSSESGVHPTEELFLAITKSNAALIDDRFMNQHANIAVDNKNIPIYTTLDFIETLSSKKIITKEQKYTLRAKLREAGLGFVPVKSEELIFHLTRSNILDGKVRPTKELKLLRENLSLLKMSRLVKLPRDAEWLQGTIRNLSNALKNQWANDIPIELSYARSNWLYELLDFRGWSHCFEFRTEEGVANFGEMFRAQSLLIAPDNLSLKLKNQYNKWLDEKVLLPMRNYDPASFNALVDSVKEHMNNNSQQDLLSEESHG